MSVNCPNTNTKEWKMLVSQCGDTLANLAFVANDHQIPDVRPLTEIKNAVGFKSKVENYASIATRIQKYNRKHGTAHSFHPTPVYGNTFELEFFPNYLPVNLEKARKRAEARGEVFKIESIRNDAFGIVYTPSLSEQEAGYFNEEGDFMPNDNLTDDIDFLIPSAGQSLADTEQVRVNKIKTEIRKEREAVKLATKNENIQGVKEGRAKLERLREEIINPLTGADQRLNLAGKVKSVKDILAYANIQLKEVDKLFTNPAMSYEDLQYSQRIVDLWRRAGDFTKGEDSHIFLDKYEYNTPEIREEFQKYRNIADTLQEQITKLQKSYFADFVREHTNGNLTNEQIFAAMKDISYTWSRTMSLRRTDDPMIQAIFTAVEAANMRAQQEADVEWSKLDVLDKAFRKASGNNYEILKQRTKDGKETGRMVSRFTDEFYKIRKSLANKAFNSKDDLGKYIRNKSDIDAYFNWVNQNTITFDSRKLFEDQLLEDEVMPEKFLYSKNGKIKYSESQRNEHITELKKHLGEKGFDFYMARQEEKYNTFRINRNIAFESIQDKFSEYTQDERDAFFEEWLKENSPYWSMDMAEDSTLRQKSDKSYYRPIGTERYASQVPKKTNNGKDTGWYDKAYEKIENNPALYEYHQYVVEMLNKMRYLLPDSKARLLGVGILPTIEKNMMDTFSEKGLMMGITPFFDKMKQLTSSRPVSTTFKGDINPLTGEEAQEQNIQFIADVESEVSALVKVAKIKHKQETGKPATNAEKKAFEEAAREQLSKQKSWDVTRIMKAHILSVLAYKHKSAIEPQIKAAESLLGIREEISLNKTGERITKKSGETNDQQGKLKHLKESFDYFMKESYYGTGGKKIEGVSSKKTYTKAEAIAKKDLEALLKKTDDEAEKLFIQEQINQLGSYITASDSVDAALKLQTLRGLGWNVFSGFSNIGFGVISNLIESSDGRVYTPAQMRKAYMLTTNSIGKNLSFNTLFNDPNSTATKIRTMMDQWDLLQTSNKELFDMTVKSSLHKLKRIGPYSIQERSEYLNYAPVMIATMMNFKAKDSDGKEVTLWDAMGADGKIKEGFTADDIDGKPFDEIKMVQKIKRVIEMNHGDYNNPLLAKATTMGRVLSQFRTWMFEGFATRWESGVDVNGKPKIDYALSYGGKIEELHVKKGRYRSYSAGQMAVAGVTLGTVLLPGVGTIIGGAIGAIGGKFGSAVKPQVEGNMISDILYTLKHLGRKLLFSKSRHEGFNDRFTAVDAANMRKNMTELYLMVTLAGVALLLKSLVSDDDDEEDFITMFLLGQTSRLQTDIGFYTNPLEAEKLTKTAIPLTGLIDDVATWFVDVAKLFDDDAKNDVFQSGTFKGDSKTWVHFAELVPGTSTVVRLMRTEDRVFD